MEDDELMQRAVARSLRTAGYRVLAASSGADALALLATPPLALDLLLTDVVLPGMSGRALADRLAGEWLGLKVLYMSGYTDNAIVLDPGMAFLQKPFAPDELLARVAALIGALSPSGSLAGT